MNRLYRASRAAVVSLSLALVLASSSALASTQTTVTGKQAIQSVVHQSIFATLRQKLLASTLGFLLPPQTASAISGVLAMDDEESSGGGDQSSYAESSYGGDNGTDVSGTHDTPNLTQQDPWSEVGGGPSYPSLVQQDPWSELGGGGPSYPSLVQQDPWSELGGGGQTFGATPTGLSESQIDFSSPSAGGWMTDNNGGGLGDVNFGNGSGGAFSSGIGSGLSDDQINFASGGDSNFAQGGGVGEDGGLGSSGGNGLFSNGTDGGLNGEGGFFSNVIESASNFIGSVEDAFGFGGGSTDVAGGKGSEPFAGAPAFEFGGGSSGDSSLSGPNANGHIGALDESGVAPIMVNQAALDDKDYAKDGMWQGFNDGTAGSPGSNSTRSVGNGSDYTGGIGSEGPAVREPGVVYRSPIDPTGGGVDETNGISRVGPVYATGALVDEGQQQGETDREYAERTQGGQAQPTYATGALAEDQRPGETYQQYFDRTDAQRPGETNQQFVDRTQDGNGVQNPNAPTNPSGSGFNYDMARQFTNNEFSAKPGEEPVELSTHGGMTLREQIVMGNYNPGAPSIPSNGAKLDGTDINLLGPNGENILVRPESILPGGENYALVHPSTGGDQYESAPGISEPGLRRSDITDADLDSTGLTDQQLRDRGLLAADEGQQLGETDQEYVARTGGQNGTQATSQTPPNPNDPFASLRTQNDADLNGYNGTGGNTKTGTNGSAAPETRTDDKADVIAARKESDSLQPNKPATTDGRTTADADLNGYNTNGQTTAPPATKTTTSIQPPSSNPQAYQDYLFGNKVPDNVNGGKVTEAYKPILEEQYRQIQEKAGPGAKLPDFDDLSPSQLQGLKNRIESVNGNVSTLNGVPVTTTQVASNAGSTGLITGGGGPGQQIGGENWMLQNGPTASASAAPFNPNEEVDYQNRELDKLQPRASVNEQLVRNEQQTQSEIAGRDNPNTTYRSVQDQLLDFNKQVEAGKVTPGAGTQPTSLEDQLNRNEQQINSETAGRDTPNKPDIDPMTITNTLNATPGLDGDNNSVKYLDRTPSVNGPSAAGSIVNPPTGGPNAAGSVVNPPAGGPTPSGTTYLNETPSVFGDSAKPAAAAPAPSSAGGWVSNTYDSVSSGINSYVNWRNGVVDSVFNYFK